MVMEASFARVRFATFACIQASPYQDEVAKSQDQTRCAYERFAEAHLFVYR